MAPFEEKYKGAEAERLSLVHKFNMLQEVCQEGKEGLKQMTEAQVRVKYEGSSDRHISDAATAGIGLS
jgi:hypothetical protein